MQTFTAPADDEVADQEAFAKARAVADGMGGSVGGVKKDDVNVYFVHPAEADDFKIRELAFEAFHGSPMDDYQRYCLREAMNGG